MMFKQTWKPIAVALCGLTWLGSASCQSARDSSSFPTLHPRERALYTTLRFEPGGTELQIASLRRDRSENSFLLTLADGSESRLHLSLLADRETGSLYSANLLIEFSAQGWAQKLDLSPRSSGRWNVTLDASNNPAAWERLEIEIESDPYWEMEQQRPLRFRTRR